MGQDLFPNLPHIAVGKHCVDQVLFMGAVKAHAFKDRAAVMGQLQDVSVFLKNMKNYPPGNTGSCGFNHSLRLFQRLDVEISDHVAGV